MAFANEIINGNNVTVAVGGAAIVCSSTCSLEYAIALRNAACKDAAGWARNMAGLKSWSVSSEHFLNLGGSPAASYKELFDLSVAGDPVAVTFTVAVGGDSLTMSGNAVISSLPMTAPANENATFSLTLTGDGELDAALVEA